MTDEDESVLQLAAHYVGAERHREALEVLRRADPGDVRTYLFRGQALIQLGQFPEAEREVRQGLELDPVHVLLLVLLAQAQTKSDAFAAEATIRQALAHDADNTMLLQTYVWILMEQGRYEAAEQVLDRAMKIAPEEMQGVRTLFLLRASSSGEALKVATQMLRDAPDDAAAHYLQGVALLSSGRAREGLRHLREAAALRPADPLFPAAARTFGAWYLWPSHVLSGPLYYVLSAVFYIAAFLTMLLAEDFAAFWYILAPWFAVIIYKWLAFGSAMLLLNLRVRRAARDAVR